MIGGIEKSKGFLFGVHGRLVGKSCVSASSLKRSGEQISLAVARGSVPAPESVAQ